jgi:ribonucleoside-triphosphate reductase
MSIKALSDYTFYSRYARYNKDKKRRETWEEAVGRVFNMHRKKYAKQIEENPELEKLISFAQQMQNKKRILAAQRSLQFAGDPIFKHQLKMFNCLTTHINRPRVFQETMYALLCGCGVGFSVQKQHINNLGDINRKATNAPIVKYVIEDSIEGWADAVGVLFDSYYCKSDCFKSFHGCHIEFDFSKIRPEGSLIAGQFKAPGPNGLKAALEKIKLVVETRINSEDFSDDEFKLKLRPIDAYDSVMHISDAVLSGGVRRSATLCMFSHDDEEMMNAKIGDWFIKNPQRGRSNNSAALLKGHVSSDDFNKLIKSTKEFGEPGFIWVDDLDIIFNPCCEIGMIPKTIDGRSGWQSCNLTEINGKWCDSEENFLKSCEASAIVGTLQAGYTDLKYFEPESKEIFEYEALLGCSITGMMDNPDILFDPEIQRKGASKILEVNEKIAKMIGINPCARATCIKPAGSTSCVLGTASGIHPHHAKRYIRRVQANKSEFCLQETLKKNPLAVEESVWSANKTDMVISFLCEVPQGAIIKNQLKAVDLLEKIKITQQNWVEYGTRIDRCINSKLRHNVSNTCFHRHEKFPTTKGIQSFDDFSDGDAVEVFDYTGNPRKAIVKNFGKQELYDLVLTNGKTTKTIKTTKNHIWLVCNKNKKYSKGYTNHSSKFGYKMVTTDNLKNIKNCQIPKINISQNRNINYEAFCHGFVFGDGSKHYTRENESTHVKIFDSCRTHIANIFKTNIPECSFIEKDDHIYIGKLNPDWKKLPKDSVDCDYIFSFISGWFAADGYVASINDNQRSISLTHKNEDNIKWLYDKSPMAGFSVNKPTNFIQTVGYNIGECYSTITFVKSSMNDNFFAGHPDKYNRWLQQKQHLQNSKYFTVVDVIPTGIYDDVFCIVEPETSTFLLDNNILTHNCSVKPDEWEDVEKFIFDNQQWFAGISLLSSSGDLDYAQAPFATVLTPFELVREYGDASVFASGLVVDGLAAFNDNLWRACDTVLGFGENLSEEFEKPEYPSKKTNKELAEYFLARESFDIWFNKKDWVRRVQQFAERYFEGDIKRATYCLKHVSLWKTWCDLKREYVEINWEDVVEEYENHINADTLGAQACSGGSCEIL